MSEQKKINIRNKRATFDYEILEEYVAGIVLVGTEIKSIRAGKASLTDSFCYFDRGELWIRGVNIAEYAWGTCNNHTPRRDRFKVAGIYSSGMDEMDNTVILTDLRNVQRLSDWAPDEISGYEVFTDDLAGADDFARRLGHTLLYDEDDATANLAVTSVTELYASIFDWLKAHDVNAAVIIVIMLVVAFFNMTSALLILVLERTRMIGLLKAFGMRNGQLRQVFLWRASFITLRGLAWGNAVGLGLCFVQRYFHVVRLSSEGYLLSEVPISLGWGWWLALNAGAVAAIVALLVKAHVRAPTGLLN